MCHSEDLLTTPQVSRCDQPTAARTAMPDLACAIYHQRVHPAVQRKRKRWPAKGEQQHNGQNGRRMHPEKGSPQVCGCTRSTRAHTQHSIANQSMKAKKREGCGKRHIAARGGRPRTRFFPHILMLFAAGVLQLRGPPAAPVRRVGVPTAAYKSVWCRRAVGGDGGDYHARSLGDLASTPAPHAGRGRLATGALRRRERQRTLHPEPQKERRCTRFRFSCAAL